MPAQAKRRLHWFCSLPTPYNHFLFSKIANTGEFDLLVHFRTLTRSSHPWKGLPQAEFLWRRCGRTGWMDLGALRPAFSEEESYFVLGGWSDPWMCAVLWIRMIRGFPFAVWTDGPDTRLRPGWKHFLRSRWLALVFLKADKVFVTSRSGVEPLRRLGCPPEKIVVFPYWVRLPPVPLPARSSSTAVRFFGLGRLEPLKQYDLAISAMKLLIEQLGPAAAGLTLSGDGSQVAKLKQLAQDFRVDGCVTLAGWQEHAEAMLLLEESDVFVHPAQWEPYGVGILEAMARGKPVIASRATLAAADRVRHGINGFLFETGDAGALAECMGRFVREPQLILRMGREARKTSEEWPVEKGLETLRRTAARRIA